MIITKALSEEYPEVRLFYHSVIDAFQDAPYRPMWEKDIYPSPEELQSAIAEGTLFIGRIDSNSPGGQRIAGAMVVNQKYNESYHNAVWPTDLKKDEFMVIHMLGVHTDFAGRGFAGKLVEYAIACARDAGMKAIRLDVLKGNLPANRLYEALGFQYVDTVSMFYEDTGWTDFELYELTL